jgi:DNA-binding NarL/FixJ family response regulator
MTSSETRTRILIVDEPSILREGIAALISVQPDMQFVGYAPVTADVNHMGRECRPDVMLIDAREIETIRAVSAALPALRIVALGNREADVPASRALQAGAVAYLLKNAPPQELLDAVRAVRLGRRHVSRTMALELAQHAAEDVLTAREIQILQHAAEGGVDKHIAAALSLSVDTVKAHMKNARAKLRASSRTHAVSIAVRRGIFDL